MTELFSDATSARAFALYYALQCALAASLCRQTGGGRWRCEGFALLTVLALLIAAFGVSVEGHH